MGMLEDRRELGFPLLVLGFFGKGAVAGGKFDGRRDKRRKGVTDSVAAFNKVLTRGLEELRGRTKQHGQA